VSSIGKRAMVLGAAVIVVVAAVLAAFILADGAPASTQKTAPVWLSTANVTSSGQDIRISGGIDVRLDLSTTMVAVSKREVGETVDTHVADVPVNYNLMTGNLFDAIVPAVTHSCLVTVSWQGKADYLAGSTWMFVGVRPTLTVEAPVATRKKTRLRITISPAQPLHRQGMSRPPFLAGIECRIRGVWRQFPGELGVAGTDGMSWCTYDYFKVKPGTYTIRGRFYGTNFNVASFSKPVRIVVR
jgi:hypothetical protein